MITYRHDAKNSSSKNATSGAPLSKSQKSTQISPNPKGGPLSNLNALDSQWERRKKELLVQKAAARLKKDSKREQVEKAKLKKFTAANDGSLMAGIRNINKDQPRPELAR